MNIARKFFYSGFSLPELLTYSALGGIVAVFMYSLMNSFTTKEHNIQEINRLIEDKNITTQEIRRLIAKSELNPVAYDGDTAVAFAIDDINFTNQNGKCLDFNENVNESFVRHSLWLGYKEENGSHAIYHGNGIGCEENLPESIQKISELNYIKKDTGQPWFISNNQTVQFNLQPQGKKIGGGSNALNINLNTSQTVIKYNKIQEIGCRIASPNQAWFAGLSSNYRYGFVIFTSNYKNSQDRLTLTGVNCSGNNSTSIDGITVNCLFCHNDSNSATKCPVTQHNIGDQDNAKGFLHLDAGSELDSAAWEKILNEVEYTPRCSANDGCTPPIIINPGSERDANRLVSVLLSNNESILQSDQNLGTAQGSFLLNLYRLSQSCTHENF